MIGKSKELKTIFNILISMEIKNVGELAKFIKDVRRIK